MNKATIEFNMETEEGKKRLDLCLQADDLKQALYDIAKLLELDNYEPEEGPTIDKLQGEYLKILRNNFLDPVDILG